MPVKKSNHPNDLFSKYDKKWEKEKKKFTKKEFIRQLRGACIMRDIHNDILTWGK